MTPVYLNPPPSPFPLVELKEEQRLQLFLSPQQAASSLSASVYFNSTATHQDQRVAKPEESKPHDHKGNKFMTHNGSSDQQASSSSSLQSAADQAHNSSLISRKEDGDCESASDNGSSVKWMPSKVRLMKRMMNSNCSIGAGDYRPPKFAHKFQHPMHDSDETSSFSKTNNTVRVCSDCNTTTTPLWRSGPRGPKSLCNACGIRQRKARRAMEAAAAAAADNGAADASSMKIKVHIHKEKKSRTGHVAQCKKQFKPPCYSPQSQKKLCFKEFALSLSENSALQRVFPQDVEDAAILLMELSCGLVHS